MQTIDFPRYRRALFEAGQVLALGDMPAAGWDSRAAWNADKRGYEWLFDAVDKDGDGRISADEYREFQDFKRRHADWERRLKPPGRPPRP